MKGKQNFKNTGLPILIIIILAYIVLFEFILPVNRFLPKPSTLIESITPLHTHYFFFQKFIYSASVVYLSMIIAYVVMKLISGGITKAIKFVSDVLKINSVVRYLPTIALISVFILWFPQSSYSEFILFFIISFLSLSHRFRNEIFYIKKEYFESVVVNAINKNKVINEILWKSAEPKVFRSLRHLHLLIWQLILFFEFIKGTYGLGTIYSSAVQFKDLSALIVLTIFLMLLLFMGDLVIKFLQKKFIWWES